MKQETGKTRAARPSAAKAISTRLKLARAFAAGRDNLDYPPLFLWVEPTNRCNLRCPMCPQSEGLKRPQGDMNLELFGKIITEAAGLIQVCSLHFGGEPLMNKNLAEMIRKADSLGLPTVIHTNGTLMTRRIAAGLIGAGLEQAVFSFDAVPPEDYSRKRAPASFDRTLEKIRGFLEEKKKLRSRWPITTIKALVEHTGPGGPTPRDAERELRKLFEGLPADNFAAEWIHTFSGDFATRVVNEKRYGFPGRSETHPCALPWYGFAVGWDGRAFACCNDLNGEYCLGDLTKQSIMEVWNGERARGLRRKLAGNQRDKLPLCVDCDALWRNFDSASVRSEGLRYILKHIARPAIFRKK